ncbi:MAG: hypothetical protein ACO3O9_05005 [Candidatus Nanopelagicales bacterium]
MPATFLKNDRFGIQEESGEKMRRGRQIVVIVVFIAVVASAILWFNNRDTAETSQFLTAKVTNEQILNSTSTTGVIVDQYTYLVNDNGDFSLTQINGVATTSGGFPADITDDWKLVNVLLKEGSKVVKGETVLVLENYDGSTEKILAPRRGEILRVNYAPNMKVSGNLFKLGSGKKLLSVPVSEGDLVKLTNDQPVLIDSNFIGKVINISPIASTSVEGNTTYQVLIEPETGRFADSIKSGMTATVEFVIDNEKDPKYTNAKFLYEYEFEVNTNSELTLTSRYGQTVSNVASTVSNKDSWTVESMAVALGDYVDKGDTIAILRNFDGTIKNVDSPESGYVREIFTTSGAYVSGALIEIGVGYRLAAVEVSEFDIGQIEVGQTATFSTSDQAEEFEAEVLSISSKALVDTSAVAKFKVYLKPLDSNASFRIGASVRANIILQATSSQKAVPVQALKEVNNEYVVEVLDSNGVAIERQVQVGVIGDEFAEIISGLELEDEVVIGNRAPQDVLPTQPTGPFGEGGNDSNETE